MIIEGLTTKVINNTFGPRSVLSQTEISLMVCEDTDHCAKDTDHCAKDTDHCAKDTDHCVKDTDHCAKDTDHCVEHVDHGAKDTDQRVSIISPQLCFILSFFVR